MGWCGGWGVFKGSGENLPKVESRRLTESGEYLREVEIINRKWRVKTGSGEYKPELDRVNWKWRNKYERLLTANAQHR